MMHCGCSFYSVVYVLDGIWRCPWRAAACSRRTNCR